jgi:hypothetical protein
MFARIACLALVLVAPASAACAADPVVSRAAFAGGIAEREAYPALDPTSTVAPGPLWFWTEISAGASTLDSLAEQKRLPLRHAWYRTSGGAAGDDLQPDFVRELEELDDVMIDKLRRELNLRTSRIFTYRTSSCRTALAEGAWVVKVTDRFGTVLNNAQGRDARYEIVVHRGGQTVRTPCPPKG